jgi:hypothetical protein
MCAFLEGEKKEGEEENSKKWNSDSYLKLFSDWQNVIPEVCWIEDFYRKYFRPNNVY